MAIDDPPHAAPRVVWLLATPLVILLTHFAAVLPHEFAHSVVAWVLGVEDQPGNIDRGGRSRHNVLLLVHMDENVDYPAALAAGKTRTDPRQRRPLSAVAVLDRLATPGPAAGRLPMSSTGS